MAHAPRSAAPALTIGVLDQSPVRSGGTPAEAIAETVRLAQACERLGYRRYWLAEHHGTDGFAGSAPEILIPHVAHATATIRVGSGGVMLSHYSPFKVAEVFRLLETMFPGRIDLGIGRAPGSDQLTAAALAYGNQLGLEYFPTKIADLVAFLSDTPPPTRALARVRATPKAPGMPEIWVLGSSGDSASYAALFGLPYAYAHFIAGGGGEEAVGRYRAAFSPSDRLATPRTSLAVFALCADTEAEAERLARSRDLWRLRLERGELGPYPSVEEAEAYPYSDVELAAIARTRARTILGTPAQVKARLEAMAAAHGADELVIVTITHDFAARLRSYELIAQAFGLAGR
ncbi:MAG: LLM class flavin-dependent oxidoreductase [Alphaproteobacteria bacterium]|nr:LLM class flavin-dependent oxidoreductase [Alphaproteobacteria bacterium]